MTLNRRTSPRTVGQHGPLVNAKQLGEVCRRLHQLEVSGILARDAALGWNEFVAGAALTRQSTHSIQRQRALQESDTEESDRAKWRTLFSSLRWGIARWVVEKSPTRRSST